MQKALDHAIALLQQNRLQEADAAFGQLQSRMSGNANFLTRRAGLKRRLGDVSAALELLHSATALAPDDWYGALEYGRCMAARGQYSEAIDAFVRSINLRPDAFIHYFELGSTCLSAGIYKEAQRAFTRALARKPDSAAALANLGTSYEKQYRWQEAEQAYSSALKLDAGLIEIWNNLGCLARRKGQTRQAIAIFRRALQLQPENHIVNSNLLLTLLSSESHTPAEIYRAHAQWGETLTGQAGDTAAGLHKPATLKRRLRVAYLSPDFRMHPVAYFIKDVLRFHDRSTFEVFCYSLSTKTDAVSRQIQANVERWVDAAALSPQELGTAIKQEEIDILVDLAGHTENNCIPVLAERAAPIQFTYLGYGATTGLDAVDYLLTDAQADPVGKTEQFHTETLIRIPDGHLAYSPPIELPPVNDPPVLENGYITFGSFNNTAKMSPGVLDAWADILHAIPASRLFLKTGTLSDESVQRELLRQFGDRDIARNRLMFSGRDPDIESHFEQYHKVDIALDTYPYNGVTTTCDALWMGLPVITLAGDSRVSRTCSAILKSAGLTQWIVDSSREYIDLAVALAGDMDQLKHKRRRQRKLVTASPLADCRGLAGKLEDIYAGVWSGQD